MQLATYLPQDRLRAVAAGTSLPDRAAGSVLLADISGFTALTESLREALGVRRGAEELGRQLGEAYSALIAAVERYGGSVVCFAGDSVTCWFDATDGSGCAGSVRRAVRCAIRMQTDVGMFPTVGLKVTIVSGSARRFLVGDPDVQVLDVIAGNTVTAACVAQHAAQKGDVLVDEDAAKALDGPLIIDEWRTEDRSGRRFGVIRQMSPGDWEPEADHAPPDRLPVIHDPSVLRRFVHDRVLERDAATQGAFSTEFRPCVAVFAGFSGIDFESDSAEAELDAIVRTMQRIAGRHGGAVMDVTTGDDGTCAYINFGALRAHEDDALRAVKAASTLRSGSPVPLQVGIAHGTMRVGAFGGVTRRTFGALGDDVNLAARLMSAAAPGEILVSGYVHAALRGGFIAEPRSPVAVRGKSHPVPVYAVSRPVSQRFVRLEEPIFELPMVGRDAELALLNGKLDLALGGAAQVVGVVADAGMGKSRLVAEAIRSARAKGFAGYGGVCRTDGVNTPYYAWKPVWSAFFDIDPSAPARRQIRALRTGIEDLAPSRTDALPLLGTLLDIAVPDNDLTRALEPKDRRSLLHATLRECMEAATREEPLLIVIEDAHLLDELSHDLLAELAAALAEYPVCFVIAYRPPEMPRLQAPRLEALPHFTRIKLAELTPDQAEHVIRGKLAQLYPERSAAVPPDLTRRLVDRSQGNPFYLEELLNYLHDRGLDPLDPAATRSMDLPDNLHRLILTRMDQLTSTQRTVLRAASVIGRSFSARWLAGYCPELGDTAQVLAALEVLQRMQITICDTTEPDPVHLFRHVVIHEVAYESLPYAVRAGLHRRLAAFLESEYSEAPPVAALAFHYGRSANTEKQRIYLRRAAEAAQRTYANTAAVTCYGELLPILTDVRERIEIHMRRAEVLQLTGAWPDSEADYRSALELAEQVNDTAARQAALFALGQLCRLRGDLDPAQQWLAQARAACIGSGDRRFLARVLIEAGVILLRKGEYAPATEPLQEGLTLAREFGDTPSVALALNNLGNAASRQTDFAGARAFFEQSLAMRRELGDREGISATLCNLAIMTMYQGDYPQARPLLEESMKIDREMGDRWGLTIATNAMGLLLQAQRDHSSARRFHEESLAIARELDDRWNIGIALNNLGHLELAEGNHAAAVSFYSRCLEYSRAVEDRSMIAHGLFGMGLAELALNQSDACDHLVESLRLRLLSGQRLHVASSLVGIAALLLRDGDASRAAQLLGAVDAALAALGAAWEPVLQHIFPSLLATARDALGDTAFRAARDSGAALTLDEAAVLSGYGGPVSHGG